MAARTLDFHQYSQANALHRRPSSILIAYALEEWACRDHHYSGPAYVPKSPLWISRKARTELDFEIVYSPFTPCILSCSFKSRSAGPMGKFSRTSWCADWRIASNRSWAATCCYFCPFSFLHRSLWSPVVSCCQECIGSGSGGICTQWFTLSYRLTLSSCLFFHLLERNRKDRPHQLTFCCLPAQESTILYCDDSFPWLGSSWLATKSFRLHYSCSQNY